MLKDTMEKALNDQMMAEIYSSNLYLAMAAYFDAQTMEGFAHWLKVQAKEEMGHGMKFYGHIKDRLGRVSIGAVDAPPAEWKSPLAAFEAVYAHECKVTALIDRVLAVAVKEKDTAAAEFLQWFVKEQVEEEAQADAIVQKLKLVGSAAPALLVLDSMLAKREG